MSLQLRRDVPLTHAPLSALTAALPISDASEVKGVAAQEALSALASLEALLQACEPVCRIVHRDEHLFRGGDAQQFVYYVRSGFVKTEMVSEDGRQVLTGVHLRGDLLGLEGLAAQQHRCDAVALETGQVWELPVARLLACAAQRPSLQSLLVAAMGAEICRDRARLLDLSSLPAQARVAGFLHDLSQRFRRGGYSGSRLNLRMTRAEVGSYLGLKLETVSRCLTRLADEGLIRVSMKAIDIVDGPQLCRLGMRELAA